MDATLHHHVAALSERGFTVIDGTLTAAEIEDARAALDEVFGREERIGRRRGWRNDTYEVVYMLPQKHPLFRSFCQREPLLSLVRAALGPRCVVSALNGLRMTPNGKAQRLHIDQEETVVGATLSVNALHTLDDFTRENGATRLIPGSHRRAWTGDAAAIEAAEREAVYVEAPAGSLIAYDGALWHAGSRNGTQRERRAIHAYFAREWMRPHWDFTRSLSPDVAAVLTPEQRALFGFSAVPRLYDHDADRIARGDATAGGRAARLRGMVRSFAARVREARK